MNNVKYHIIGTSPPRVDAYDKVTGRAVFGPDVTLPGMLHGRLLGSPYAHAVIRSIDTSRAEALTGVFAVMTSKDMPSTQSSDAEIRYEAMNVIAGGKALFEGHVVAAVAAVSPQVAEDAVRLIKVDYEPLKPVLDLREAMREDAPIIHSELRRESTGPDDGEPGNVVMHFKYGIGDVEKGFKDAEVIVEREYSTTNVHQGYIEPQVATARWGPEDTLTLWCSTQGQFIMRQRISKLLELPLSKIRVIPTEVGGAFGGKYETHVDPIAAILARKAGRPVKVVMTQAEVFRSSGPAPSCIIHMKMGTTRKGRITAVKAELYYEAGAFPGSPLMGGARCMLAAYDIPNGQIEGFEVLVNKSHVTAYRAPGVPQSTFAAEQAIDELSEKLGMDPIEFRLLNVAREGTKTVAGIVHSSNIGAAEVLQAARSQSHYKTPLVGANGGRGIAVGYWGNNGGQSSCLISVNQDGGVSLVTGSVDLTGTRTSLAMQAAEVLGLSIDLVRTSVGDTDSIGYTEQSGGSRTTFATGRAVILAAEDVVAQMCGRAALIWKVPVDDVTYDGMAFTTKTDASKRLTFADVAARLSTTGGPVTGKGSIDARGWGPSVACQVVDVEVDHETGKVKVLRYTAVQNVGKAVHPVLVESQMQGAVAQGMGWALWEGYSFNGEGRLLNPNRLDYKQPTFLDVPSIDTVFVEIAGPNHPFGVRGVGEAGFTPTLAALANAVSRAVGKRIYNLPMSPDRVLQAMKVI